MDLQDKGSEQSDYDETDRGVSSFPPISHLSLYPPISQFSLRNPSTSLIVDYFFWLGVSLVVVSIISIVWSRIRRRQLYERTRRRQPTITGLED